jgi:hypothetical protein
MGVLRAEAVRTLKEMGYAREGERIIMVDRTVGKRHDNHLYAHNMVSLETAELTSEGRDSTRPSIHRPNLLACQSYLTILDGRNVRSTESRDVALGES